MTENIAEEEETVAKGKGEVYATEERKNHEERMG